ncbi:MAG TPA: cupin domain-containing protein [Polyangiaceae bacterium]|nr:cupin domain-containing protein [Polyangiaceae bacterium]
MWQSFRPGIEIRRLFGDGTSGPAAALLKYAPSTSLSRHSHPGYELIFVLRGSQRDERGRYGRGSLRINAPGSTHSVTTDEGCVVFVVWQRPVAFVAPES